MEIKNTAAIISQQDALGQRGTIIQDIDGTWHFRVYDKTHNFVDYVITHRDLDIVIADWHAELIQTTNGNFLDYAAHSLGHKKSMAVNDIVQKTD